VRRGADGDNRQKVVGESSFRNTGRYVVKTIISLAIERYRHISQRAAQISIRVRTFQVGIHVPLRGVAVAAGLGHVLEHGLLVVVGLKDSRQERLGTL